MAYTNIDLPTDYFNTKLYTGNNNVTQTISGVGFKPDLVWIKNRDNVEGHYLFDYVRGSGNILQSNSTNGDQNLATNTKPTIASDGFTLTSNGTNDELNFGSRTYVSWNWLASNTTVSNTSGSITSTVSANTTSGFSVVSYTGNGSSGATVGHGIGSTVGMILVKGRSFVDNWAVYHKSIGGTGLLELNGTGGTNTVSTRWNDTNAGATVFTLGNNSQVNGSGSTYIAYCFAEVKGFSKFGSYTGNGSTDGTFIYTGFKPAFLIVKRYNDAGYDWLMYDNKRQVEFNVVDDFLKSNLGDVETTGNANQSLDFLSNGIKFRGSGASSNGSGATYIYMAFAEQPLVGTNNVPATAR